MKSSFIVPCALAWFALSACADEDTATIAAEHPTPPSNDAATSHDGAADDGSSGEGASGDGSQAEAAGDSEAGNAGEGGDATTTPDTGRREGGPGGDGGIVIGGGDAASDA